MVKYDVNALNHIFSALSDPTRRAALERLSQGEASVTELAVSFNMSLPAISKHLRSLEKAGFITRSKEGRMHRLRLEPRALQNAAAWIALYRPFWEGQLNALGHDIPHQTDDSPKQPPQLV